MSDPINDDENDGFDDVLVNEDDDHHDCFDEVLIDVDDDDDENDDDDDDDDDDDAMYDVLSNDIHLSSTTFEWLNGMKKN